MTATVPPVPITMYVAATPARTTTGLLAVVNIGFVWRRDDPLAVSILLSERAWPLMDSVGVTHWWTSRDLLADGLREPVGPGDFSVAPCKVDPEFVKLTFHNSVGGPGLVVKVHSLALRRFLHRTYLDTPPGAEVLDFDISELIDDVS